MALQRWVAALVCLSVLAGSVVAGEHVADGCPPVPDEPLAALKGAGLVRGVPGGALALDRPMTRAELIVFALRARGQEEIAALMASVPDDDLPWPDAAGHWARNHLLLAGRVGLIMGYPDGSVRPDAAASRAEILTVIARLLNIRPESDRPWPENYFVAIKRTGDFSAFTKPASGQARALRAEAFRLADAMLRTAVVYENRETWYQRFWCE